MTSVHPSRIEIDVKQLRLNLLAIRGLLGKSRLCFPVKANAYGHGLVPVAKISEDLVDCYGVSSASEGICLREAGIKRPILVFGAIHEEQIDALIHYDLEFSISSRFKAEMVAKRGLSRCRVHLEVDTGMQRTGVRPETAVSLMQYLQETPCFEVVGVYSHLASLETTPMQLDAFKMLLKHPLFSNIPAHLANSTGLLYSKETHLDMVRPGLLAYGYGKLDGVAPCFSLKSKIAYCKVVEPDTGIGYGHTYHTKTKSRIATVPVGYGDGYNRALSNKADVLIRGKRYPIAGSICMDQFMVDMGLDEGYVGDEVVLIGKQGDLNVALEELSFLSQTIPYEILCLFNDRIPRQYVTS